MVPTLFCYCSQGLSQYTEYWPLTLHCIEDPIHVFPKMKLCGLSPHFHIHVSVSDLYIPSIGPPILLQQNRPNHGGNISIVPRYMSAGIGNEAVQFHFWEYLFQIFDTMSFQCTCLPNGKSYGSEACRGQLFNCFSLWICQKIYILNEIPLYWVLWHVFRL